MLSSQGQIVVGTHEATFSLKAKKYNFNIFQFIRYLHSRAIYFLMNIHVVPTSIYLTRHGESMLNLSGRIGGDSGLSPRGNEYGHKLAEFIKSQDIPDLKVGTFIELVQH